MKKILIVLTILLSLSLVACSKDNTSTKAVEDGKIALVSKEYDKARNLFKLAVDEDNKNTDAKSLLDLTTNYIDLIAIIETNEFDKANDIISKIEKNSKLDIIKDEFIKTKNSIVENKAMFDKYVKEVESIEKLLNENKIDDAKKDATAKLEKVKGIKSLEDRLNAVITKVDEKIANAKAEILKYYDGDYGVKYSNMEYYSNNSNVKELKGKTMYRFYEKREHSPREYFYDESTKDVFLLQEGGEIFKASDNNKLIYRPKELEEAYARIEALEKEQEEIAKSKIKISSEESRQIALNYYLRNHPDTKADEIMVAMGDDINENNEYYRGIAGYIDDAKTMVGKPIAEYYVNATTGEVRVLWD